MNTDSKFYQSITNLAVITGALLLIPLVAMQFTDEVVWDETDFIVAGTLLFGTGLTYKLITKKAGNWAYRVAVGFALFTGLFLVWVNLAVGIIGSEDNPINLLYFAVIFVGIIGAFLARFRSEGMAITMFVMALAQALVAAIALVGGFYQSPPSTVFHIIGENGFFIVLFAVSALLFHYAAQEQSRISKNKKD